MSDMQGQGQEQFQVDPDYRIMVLERTLGAANQQNCLLTAAVLQLQEENAQLTAQVAEGQQTGVEEPVGAGPSPLEPALANGR